MRPGCRRAGPARAMRRLRPPTRRSRRLPSAYDPPCPVAFSGHDDAMGRGFVALTWRALGAPPQAALAGEARPVPHGMEVSTDAGETVRVLAYADGTFRVTVAETLPEGRPTAMVIAEPDGEPAFSATAETATLR